MSIFAFIKNSHNFARHLISHFPKGCQFAKYVFYGIMMHMFNLESQMLGFRQVQNSCILQHIF